MFDSGNFVAGDADPSDETDAVPHADADAGSVEVGEDDAAAPQDADDVFLPTNLERNPVPLSWGTNGTVHRFAASGDLVLVAGQFDEIGPRTGPFALLGTSTGELLQNTDFKEHFDYGETVRSVVSDGGGGWFVGGDFGPAAPNLVHVLPNGSFDANFVPAFAGEVWTLHLYDQYLLVGGQGGVAVLDSATGLLAPVFQPSLESVDIRGWPIPGDVFGSDLRDSIWCLGGDFIIARDSVVGHNRDSYACFDLLTWNVTDETILFSNTIRKLILDDERVYFIADPVASASSEEVYAYSRDSGLLEWSVRVGLNGYFTQIARWEGSLFVGGAFDQLISNSQLHPRSSLVELDAGTGELTAWSPSIDLRWYVGVSSMSIDSDLNRLYFGGDFSAVEGEPRGRLAAYSLVDRSLLPPLRGLGGAPIVLFANGSTLAVGGRFQVAGTHSRESVALVNTATGEIADWRADLEFPPDHNGIRRGYVEDVEIGADRIYLGGGFDSVDGHTQTGVAAVDTASGARLGFVLPHLVSIVKIEEWQDRLYVAGQFASSTTTGVFEVRAYDRLTGSRISWFPGHQWSRLTAMIVTAAGVFVSADRTVLALTHEDASELWPRLSLPLPRYLAGGTILMKQWLDYLVVGGVFIEDAPTFDGSVGLIDMMTGNIEWLNVHLGETGSPAQFEVVGSKLYGFGGIYTVNSVAGNSFEFDLVARNLTVWGIGGPGADFHGDMLEEPGRILVGTARRGQEYFSPAAFEAK
jgi:hypothetical protein